LALGIAAILVASWWLDKKWIAWAERRKAARRARWEEVRQQAETARQEGKGRAGALLRGVLQEGWIVWQDAWAAFDGLNGGRRVFKKNLGRWPVVRYPRPGLLVMKAPYTGPRRVQKFRGWQPPVLTGIALGFLNCLVYGLSAKVEDLEWVFAGAAIYGGLLSIPFWQIAKRTHFFKIRFRDGAMIWREPNWRRRVVRLEEEPRIEAWAHRLGPEEARIAAQWQATHPGRGIPAPLFQTSSELLLMTAGRPWMTVAEFTNDLGDERALRLKDAIVLVWKAAVEEKAARKRARDHAEAREL